MDKKKLYDIVDKHQQTITTLSDKVWELAELSLLEYQTADYYCELMEKLGFTVERQVANVATAFSGSYGSGHPVIGILGESGPGRGHRPAPAPLRHQHLRPRLRPQYAGRRLSGGRRRHQGGH